VQWIRSAVSAEVRRREEAPMAQGVVSWFDPQCGRGAIVVDGSGCEVAVRAADIAGGGRQSLAVGARVVFTPCDGPDGLAATNVYIP
jgi:CspA family cold shock protein